jgi:putative hemolysin
MDLINDGDLRKVLNLKENQGKLLITLLRQFLEIDKLNQIYEENSIHSNLAFVESVINKLNIKFSFDEETLKKFPATGPFIIIANHPLGGIDGLILLSIICKIRPDFKIQGNFILQQIEPIKDYIIPVNPFENFKAARSSYHGIKESYNHLIEGKPLGIFPSGEVSSYQYKDFRITDRQWQKSSIKFIKNAGVPVIPVCFNGYNSALFYLLGQIHPILRTARLPYEIFNKGNQTIKVEIRKPVSVKTINSFPTIDSLTQYLRAKTYSISSKVQIETFFKFISGKNKTHQEPLIEPVDTGLIKTDLMNLNEEYLLLVQGNFSVYCAPFNKIPHIIEEIGRLREITFRAVGEGTNNSLDLDPYDIYYNHLLIWDNLKSQIIGSYRIGKGKDILNQYGKKGFYISSLFKIKNEFENILGSSFELGRSFIIKEYQRHPLVLFLLWKGILVYLLKNPEYKYLVGPVSISNDYNRQSKSLIVQFIYKNYFNFQFSAYIKPRKKFNIPNKTARKNKLLLKGINNNIKTLDLYINEFQPNFSIPVLLKKYLQMNGKIIGFNIDPDFNNCLDGLMLVHISDIPPEMLENLSKEIKASQLMDQYSKKQEIEQPSYC